MSLLHPAIQHPLTRAYNSVDLKHAHFIYPLFVTCEDVLNPIPTLPNQYQIGLSRLVGFLTPLVEKGLKAVLLFGVFTGVLDEQGSGADAMNSPVVQAVKLLRTHFPQLLVCCDICLCAYTSHGHCGIFSANQQTIDNERTIQRLAEIGVSYAQAGRHH